MQKKGPYPTYITNKTKLSETKPIKEIYTAINSKLVNIVRIQKAIRTETTPAQCSYNTNVVLAMLC